MIKEGEFIKLDFIKQDEKQVEENAASFYKLMDKRRSVRHFSDEKIDRKIIEDLIKTASTAPSGANKQPWNFCVVANADIKKQIRIAAEKEEKESYEHRMSDEWLQDLKKLGTNWEKPFLETAPYLIIVFRKIYDKTDTKEKTLNYYVQESVGIACGILIAAIHQAGLVTLTHTPSPMNFLAKILDRPENEKPYLLLPVGYPAKDASVPDIKRKVLGDVSKWY